MRRLGRWQDAAEAFQIVLNADPHRDPIRLELGDYGVRFKRDRRRDQHCLQYPDVPEGHQHERQPGVGYDAQFSGRGLNGG